MSTPAASWQRPRCGFTHHICPTEAAASESRKIPSLILRRCLRERGEVNKAPGGTRPTAV
eukprot:scaffold31179_cov101-Isochrysis_galbana.AAC.1